MKASTKNIGVSESNKRRYAHGEKFGFQKGHGRLSLGSTGKHWKKTEEQLANKRGAKNHAWKGGITPANQKIRNSEEYAAWRTLVFARDNYTCQMCSASKVFLHADHIKPFALFPELRLEVSNGRTLCKPCHLKTDTYGGRATKRKV